MTNDQYLAAKLDDEVNMGSLENVVRLIEQGADVNGRDMLGNTPLMAASYTGQPDMARLLLARGADRSLQGFDGKTAQQMAAQVGHQEVVSVLGE